MPSEYTDGGYQRECHKASTGLKKKYYTPEPLRSKKSINEQLISAVADNLSLVTPLTPELSTVTPTESPNASEQNLFCSSIEPQPSTSQKQSQLPPVLTELITTSQAPLISESGASQSTTNQENPAVSNPDKCGHNNAPEDVYIGTESD